MDGVEDGVVEEAEDGRKVGNEVALEEEGAGDPTMPELRANQNGRLILSWLPSLKSIKSKFIAMLVYATTRLYWHPNIGPPGSFTITSGIH